ncbi:MAG: hypothetical protein PVF14_14625 [Desulfobacterales bacterium]
MTVTRLVDGGLFEVIRERYSKHYDAVTQKHNVYVRLTVLLILRPCLLLRSIMNEFHTSARRVTVNADVTYLSF